jgi:hypothetical protein
MIFVSPAINSSNVSPAILRPLSEFSQMIIVFVNQAIFKIPMIQPYVSNALIPVKHAKLKILCVYPVTQTRHDSITLKHNSVFANQVFTTRIKLLFLV